MTEPNDESYCVILNIPSIYRSKHLRNYFNELIEKKVFNCFHYRHRPQDIRPKSGQNGDKTDAKTPETIDSTKEQKCRRFCAIIAIKTRALDQLIRKFNQKFWINFDTECDLQYKCFIKKIKIIGNQSNGLLLNQKTTDKSMDLLRKTIELNSSLAKKQKNWQLMSRLNDISAEPEVDLSGDQLSLTLKELKSLRELNPPLDIMPNGNVGTPSAVFAQLIRECRLPPPVITKLDLEFPKSMRRRMYSKVEYEYKDNKKWKPKFTQKLDKSLQNNELTDQTIDGKDLDLVQTRNGLIINENFSEISKHFVKNSDILSKNNENSDDNDSDDGEVEEWDRYEALHNDVTEQERTKQRLFEEEVELKWEKGGSGLVFYTDSQFWDLMDNCGDFDEKTADDWDVDTNIYRTNCSADKEAIDLKQLRDEMALRKGRRREQKFSVDSVCLKKRKSEQMIGSFEKHTKGFGRRLMESQGWRPGQGLGHSIPGIPEPITDSGQLPSDKRGFGFRGEKLKSFQFLKPKTIDDKKNKTNF